MLAVYTFVFSVVFQARWGAGSESKTEFALLLFAGLMMFNLFAECINRAPSLILSNTNYVKKVVFPLEILPAVTLLSALFHGLISLGVWLLAYLVFGLPHATALYLPLIVLPFVLFILGLSWALASLGVFLRDVSQFIGVVTMTLMFLSPIFYPATALPEDYRHLLYLNPLTPVIEQTRDVLFWGKLRTLPCSAFIGWPQPQSPGWALHGSRRQERDLPMSSEIAIKVENLNKCYQIYEQPRDRLKQFILPRLQGMVGLPSKQYFREFWALKDVSFEVMKGETVGIIGRNGSGKSTLLQMICGTLNPTSGSIQTNGRIAALLELGSGFNPEFSGRENVYLNGAVLGLTKQEIDARFDDIAAFADIGDFIEQPVKTYSSGMMVRLAFAVSIKVDPTLMIVDEALAVGDMNFQAKCMTALSRIQDNGATVVFVSHDVGAVKSLCRQAVYLEHGQLKAIGKAPEIAEQYIRTMREEMSAEVRAFSRVSAVIPKSKPDAAEAAPINASPDIIFKRSDEFDKRVAAHRYGSGARALPTLNWWMRRGSDTECSV